MAYYGPPGYGPPQPPRGQTTRQQQVGWLKQEFGGFLIEKQRDAIYEIPIQNARFNGYIQATLPQGFPESYPPFFQAFPSVRHEWIDANGYITGHPKLRQWNSAYSTAEILQEIVQAVTGESKHGDSGSPSKGVPSRATSPSASATQNSYQELDNMTAEKLEELLADETKFSDFVHNLPQIKNAKDISEQTRSANKALADKNLAKQPELESRREALEVKRAELAEAKAQYDAAAKELNALNKKYDPNTILEQLRASAAKKDEETEDMANEFLDGEMHIKDFIKKFKEERVVFHLRAAKAERLAERLNDEKPR